MAGMTDSLRILITANGAQAEREFAKVGAAARTNLVAAETSAQRYGSVLTSAGIAMASFGAVALVGLGAAAMAADEENQALARLQNSMANSPALTGASTDAFLDQAAALQDTTQFADDATVSAQALLGQFGLTQDQIIDLIPLVQDYAAKMGISLPDAAKAVGKATAGTNTTLRRAGIQFDQTAYAADNFAGTMAALEGSVGGFAGEQGKTLGGQLSILKNNFADLAEGVGQGAIVVFEDLSGVVGGLADAFGSLSPQTQSAIGQVLTWGAVGLTAAGGISFLAGQVLKLSSGFSAIASVGPRVYAALANMIVPTEALTGAYTGLAAAETAAGAANPLVWATAALAAIPPLTAGFAALADKLGEVTGWFRVQASLNPFGEDGIFGNGIEVAGGAIGSAFADMRGEMELTDEEAAALAATFDELTAALNDYLSSNYDVPAAQRALRDSFQDLFELTVDGSGSIDQVNAALEDTVRNTADLVDNQVRQGASQSEVNASIEESRSRLLAARDAGLITAAAFRMYSDDLDGIQDLVSTDVRTPGANEARSQVKTLTDALMGVPPSTTPNVSAPGATTARSQVNNLTGALMGVPPSRSPRVTAPGATTATGQVKSLDAALRKVPPSTTPDVYTDVSRSNFDQLMADLSAANGKAFSATFSVRTLGDAIPKSRVESSGDIYVPQPVGVGKSRRSSRRGARAGSDTMTVVVPVNLDGQKVAEVVANADRRFNTARGGDGEWA